MDDLPQIDVERIDVVRIMESIRERNRRRRKRGLLTDEELEALARVRFRAFAAKAAIDPRLLQRFLDPGHDWNTATDYIIRTHRKGLLPRLGLVVKRVVRPVVRLYTDHVLNRQTQINQYLFHQVTNAIREVVRLETQVAALQRRCDALEAGAPAGRDQARGAGAPADPAAPAGEPGAPRPEDAP